jgi:hypothetical protein
VAANCKANAKCLGLEHKGFRECMDAAFPWDQFRASTFTPNKDRTNCYGNISEGND